MSNRRRSVVALLGVAALLAAVLVSATSAGAAAPGDVRIDLFPTQFSPQEIGNWQATGAINDSGSYVLTQGRFTQPGQDFCNPLHTTAFFELFTLTSSQGTLTVKDEELQVPNGAPCPPSTGVWQIVSGTGAYAGLQGHGTSQFFPTPVFDLALTGVVVAQ